jgi:hypothetical protein
MPGYVAKAGGFVNTFLLKRSKKLTYMLVVKPLMST